MDVESLIHTKVYKQNSKGGILLVGINHGYSKNDERLDSEGVDREDAYKSFFSDSLVNNYDFKNNIVKWFSMWGFNLASSAQEAGDLEMSIVQTNWLHSCTNNVNDINTTVECINDHSSFIETCSYLKPKLLLLFSKELLWAFNSEELKQEIHEIFGDRVGNTEWRQKEVIVDGKNCIRFKFGFQKYEKANIISLPHASGARGVTDEYISAFRPDMSEIINSWWKTHKTMLATN